MQRYQVIGICLAVGFVAGYIAAPSTEAKETQKAKPVSTVPENPDVKSVVYSACFSGHEYCRWAANRAAEVISKTSNLDVETKITQFMNEDEGMDVAARLADASVFTFNEMNETKRYIHTKLNKLNTYIGNGQVVTITLYNGEHNHGYMIVESYTNFLARIKNEQLTAKAEQDAKQQRYQAAVKESVDGLKKLGL
jgi:hypothetical protein